MRSVEDQLQAYGAWVRQVHHSNAADRVALGEPPARRVPRRWMVAAAAVVVVAGVAGLLALRADHRSEDLVTRPPTSVQLPDPASAAFVYATDDGRVVRYAMDSGEETQIAQLDLPTFGLEMWLTVSPDSDTVYLAYNTDEGSSCNVKMLALDASSGAVTDTIEQARDPAVSPDGSKLAYIRPERSGDSEGPCDKTIVVRDLRDGTERTWSTGVDRGSIDFAMVGWATDDQLVLSTWSSDALVLDTSDPNATWNDDQVNAPTRPGVDEWSPVGVAEIEGRPAIAFLPVEFCRFGEFSMQCLQAPGGRWLGLDGEDLGPLSAGTPRPGSELGPLGLLQSHFETCEPTPGCYAALWLETTTGDASRLVESRERAAAWLP